jgi:hydrogenase maturation protease
MRILIAGIGNIFFGDDAFGCEVAKHLSQRSLGDDVRVEDFGIRSYDLAYAMMYHDATIFVDTCSRGSSPGTLYLIEPDFKKLDSADGEVVNAHSMNPVRVLQLVRSLGGTSRPIFVVGCEPESLEAEGQLGLSDTVRAAIPGAIAMIEELIMRLRGQDLPSHGGESGDGLPSRMEVQIT